MRFGGGVIRTLGIGDSNSLVVFFLKGFSAACMFEPILQAKLDSSLLAGALHLGHLINLSASLNDIRNSNSILHSLQIYS